MTKPLEIKDCPWPWNRLYVNLNGDAKPCCYATFPIANLNDDGATLDTAWSGAVMQEVRKAIKANKMHRVCAGAGCAYIRSQFPDDMSDWKVFDVPEGIVSAHTVRLAMMGQGNACYAIGCGLQQRRRVEEACVWMERAAERGSEHALYWLATRLLSRFSDKSQLDHGIKLLEQAVANDYTPAISCLARCCQIGRGVAKNRSRAVELYRRAADRGDVTAWVALAQCYRAGIGVEPDQDEAKRHYQIAIRRGSADAKVELKAMEMPRAVGNAWLLVRRIAQYARKRVRLWMSPR